MQYDSTKFNWSAYECFDKEIKAEMTASALNKNAQGYRERFSYKVVEFSPTTDGVIQNVFIIKGSYDNICNCRDFSTFCHVGERYFLEERKG